MYRTILCMAACLCVFGSASIAADLYVDVNAKAGDGSKAGPFPTITEALATAHEVKDKDERIVIHVTAGTYKPKTAGGKEDIPAAGWSITRPIWVIGSYRRDGDEWKLKPHGGEVPKEGKITPNSVRRVELGYPETVIDLAEGGRAFEIDAPELKSSPLPEGFGGKGKTATPSMRLQGLSIRNGQSDDEGGAVLSKGNGPLEIIDCDFVGNQAVQAGGAVYVGAEAPLAIAYIRQCVFKSNAATGEDAWGGGLYSTANTHLIKCRLYGNKAAHAAAAGGRETGGWAMTFCLAYANEGDYALHLQARKVANWSTIPYTRNRYARWRNHKWPWNHGLNFRIVRCTFADNLGGGVRLVDPVDPTPSPRLRLGNYELALRGVILAGNRGAGVFYDPSDSPAKAIMQVNNSWANEGGNWKGAAAQVGNSISADPMFRDPDNPDLDKRDYSLKPGSPCIASADFRNNWGMEGQRESDLGGTLPNKSRWGFIWGDVNDMGAYVYVPREGEPEADRSKPEPLTPRELYVDRDWPGPHKGAAEAPFKSITDAVNAVRPIRGPCEVYTIRVADGVYDRSIESFGGFGIDLSYQLVTIRGGYRGWDPDSGKDAEATFDWGEESRKPRSTIVDPQGKSRAFVTNQEAITAHRLDGLTLRNGRANEPGGAFCVQGLGGEASTVGFNDCLFINNESADNGGAIAAITGDIPAYVTNCEFVNNRAGGSGGAVYWTTWDETLPLPILRCTFTGNRAGGDGGAVMIGSCERGVLFEDCVMDKNAAKGVGGAVYQWNREVTKTNAPVVVRRCRLVGNEATDGGAVYVDRNVLTVLQGCVAAGNGGDYAVRCRSLPGGMSESQRKRNPTWRRVNPRWEDWRIQRPHLPAVYAEFCTFADNQGGGIHYKDHNPEPINNDTAGVGVTDSIFTGNGGPAVADDSGKNTKTAAVAWSLFHDNARDIEGNVALGTGVVRADPLLNDDFQPKAGSPAAGETVRAATDVNGDSVSFHPGYVMGATGLVRDRADRQDDWRRAEHEFHVDASAKEGGPSAKLRAGDGSAAAPFRTLAEAVARINEMERFHRWADTYTVRVAEGTYDAGADKSIKPSDFAVDAKKPPEGLGEGLVIDKGRVFFVGSYAGQGNWRKRGERTSVIDPGRRSRAFAATPSYDVSLSFDGFTFRNGASLHGGGAIRMYGGIPFIAKVGRAELAMNNCLFENNHSWFAGGAVNTGGCVTFTATDCDFRGNEAGQGGAAFVVSPAYGEGAATDVKIAGCAFSGNRAAQGGGALLTTSTHRNAVVDKTTFQHNAASVTPRPRGWTIELRGGRAVFLLFCPELPGDLSNSGIVGRRLMQKSEFMTFRECRFDEQGGAISAQPIVSGGEKVIHWIPSWVFKDCRVNSKSWAGFEALAPRHPGTERLEAPANGADEEKRQ